MITLYSGSGSSEIQLLVPVDADEWSGTRDRALQLLRARQHQDAAHQFYETTSFEIWSGTNSFGDDFFVLYLPAPPETYVAFERTQHDALQRLIFRQIADALNTAGAHDIRFIAVGLSFPQRPLVSPPAPQLTSATVEAALADAQQLIAFRGPQSAVDRVHTAIHGYLRLLCTQESIQCADSDGASVLFKKLRLHHSKLAPTTSDPNVARVLGGLATILDGLNTIRNNNTLAHPTDALLDVEEATLMINAARTLFHFIDAKIA